MKIAVFGSGLIGTYVGGSLRSAGANVVFIGRARMQQIDFDSVDDEQLRALVMRLQDICREGTARGLFSR